MEVAVRVKNVTKKYKLYEDKWGPIKEIFSRKKLHKEFWALKNITLDFPKGESIGILGKNGSGKSTLLKIITGVAEPTSGSVEVNGSLVFLDVSSGIDSELSGYDNIFLKGTLLGYSKEEMMEKVEDIIKFSELGEFIYQPVKTYSAGMKSKLGFAISVNVDPDILIVDEALAVGDAMFRKKCMEKMNQFKKEGKTIIFVSHDKNAVESFCTKAAWINEGELIAYGDSKVIASYYNEYMSGRKSIEEIRTEVQCHHSLEELSFDYSNGRLSIRLNGYIYNKEQPDIPVEFAIRDMRVNQVLSKKLVRVSYEKDPFLPEHIKEKAGFLVDISEEEFPGFFKPGKFSFEIRYKRENRWNYIPIWSGNVRIVGGEGDEGEIQGRYKYRFVVENNQLFLQIDNVDKVQEQVNNIWFENRFLHIEYVAFVRGYQTLSPEDVSSNFYLVNLDTFDEYMIPSTVSETEEITENPVFNPQGKIYNYSKFHVSINLDELPKGRYECKLSYHMKKPPYHEMLILAWATKTANYPSEPYVVGDKCIEIQIKSKYLQIVVSDAAKKDSSL
ncbi:ABC transporter ATP-binding protein [Geobacillus thermodenitrificans]|uniref:ABC transporter ATP-binding protein n=1 Tax=Geobacillus thermodenitrificans TaxID=33940 RepID=UPI003D21B4FE